MTKAWSSLALAVLTTFTFAAIADEPVYEYGELSEMYGLTKLHIDAGSDVDLYQIMRRIVEKREPRIKVVPPDEAELAIVLSHRMTRDSEGRRYFMGELHVAKLGGQRLRLLTTYRHDEAELDDLADEIVKAFLKGYRRANSGSR